MSTVPYPAFDGTQLCAQIGTEAYFADNKTLDKENRRARELCSGCAWQQPCLEYAVHWLVEGVWGGTSLNERRRIRRRRGIVGTPLVARERADRVQMVRRLTNDGVPTNDIAVIVGVSPREVQRLRGLGAA